VPIVPRLEHADRRLHQIARTREMADASQLVGNDVLLQLQLQPVVRVLPATAPAAHREVRTRRLDPARSLPLNCQDLAADEVAMLLLHLDNNAFARQPLRDEYHASIREV